jgi:hypothetical protein
MTVFDTQTGQVVEETQPLQEPKGYSTYILYLFDADHDLLVQSHYINRDGSLRFYDLKQGRLLLTLFSNTSLNGNGTYVLPGYYLPVTHLDGERYLLDIRWFYQMLIQGR